MEMTALIVGAGSGISASFARLLAKNGYRVALASRDRAKLARLAAETNATTYTCDAADPASVDGLFAHIGRQFPQLDVCLFNASARAPGPISDVDREQLRTAAAGAQRQAEELAQQVAALEEATWPAPGGSSRPPSPAISPTAPAPSCTPAASTPTTPATV